MRVAILHAHIPDDAPEDEKDALVQATEIAHALRRLGHVSLNLELTLDLEATAQRLRAARADLVFNLVESVEGSGQLIHLAPTLLDYLGLAYTGCPTEAMLLTSNKLLAKRMLADAGIATAPWVAFGPFAGGAAPDGAPGRWIVKSAWEHASSGLDHEALLTAATAGDLLPVLASRPGGPEGRVYAEGFIDGREFNAGLLDVADGPLVLPLGEILFVDYPDDKPRIVDYKAKWETESFEYKHTRRTFAAAPADAALRAEIAQMALRCWRLFGLSGYARVDFRVDPAGRPWVLEVNANPCISSDAGYAAMLQEAGMPYDRGIEEIVQAALRRGRKSEE
jgi:D-alanine-D-alanine ligase